MDHAVVGGCSKSNESHQGIWLPVIAVWCGLFYNEILQLATMKRVVLMVVLTLASCNSRERRVDEKAFETNELPSINLSLATGGVLNTHSLAGKCILIFFSPDCDHCQREATAIQKEIQRFKDYTLYFIASNPADELLSFSGTYSLAGYPNVFFARAKPDEVSQAFGSMGVPTIFVYSSEKTLTKRFSGETDVDDIIDAL